MRHITIDGDDYLLDLPYDVIWEQAFRHIPKETQKLDGANTMIWRSAPFDGSDDLLYVAVRMKDEIKYCGTQEDVSGNFRPALKMQFPVPKYWNNGRLVTGGSLYINDEPIILPRNWRSMPNFSTGEIKKIAIGDTDEDSAAQIKWVFWEGYLIATKVLVTHIPFQKLKEVLDGKPEY